MVYLNSSISKTDIVKTLSGDTFTDVRTPIEINTQQILYNPVKASGKQISKQLFSLDVQQEINKVKGQPRDSQGMFMDNVEKVGLGNKINVSSQAGNTGRISGVPMIATNRIVTSQGGVERININAIKPVIHSKDSSLTYKSKPTPSRVIPLVLSKGNVGPVKINKAALLPQYSVRPQSTVRILPKLSTDISYM